MLRVAEQVSAFGGRLSGLVRGGGLRAELLRGGVGSMAVKTASTGVTFLAAVVLARALGAEGYGVYAYVFALISLLAIPAQFGLPTLVLRETARAQATEQWGLMRGLWRWANAAAGGLSLLLAVAGGVLAWIFADRFTDAHLATFAWGLLLVPLIALGNLRAAALRGLRRVVAGQLPEFVLRPGLLIVFMLAALLLWPAGRLDASHAMAFHAAAAALAFAIGAWILARARPAPVRMRPAVILESRVWMTAALPLAFLAGMTMINQNIGTLLLGLFASAEEVGIYRVALVAGSLVVFGLEAVNMVVAPHFARLHACGDRAQLQRLATMSARASLLMALPVAVVFILWGGDLLRAIFGAEFAAGHTALAILAVGQIVNAGVGSVGYLLNMTGHERDTARGVAIAAGGNVALSLILIPPFGMTGAALAFAGTLIVWNLLLRRDARRRLGVEPAFIRAAGLLNAGREAR